MAPEQLSNVGQVNSVLEDIGWTLYLHRAVTTTSPHRNVQPWGCTEEKPQTRSWLELQGRQCRLARRRKVLCPYFCINLLPGSLLHLWLRLSHQRSWRSKWRRPALPWWPSGATALCCRTLFCGLKSKMSLLLRAQALTVGHLVEITAHLIWCQLRFIVWLCCLSQDAHKVHAD